MDNAYCLPNPGLTKPLDFKFFEIPEKKEFYIFPNKNQIVLEETDTQYLKGNFMKTNFKIDTIEDEEKYLEKLYLISDLKSSLGINPQSDVENINNNNKEEIFIRHKTKDEKRELIERKNIFLIKKIKYKKMGRRKTNSIYLSKAHHGKNSEDNIIRKAKIYFINSALSYINNQYKVYQEKKYNQKCHKKLIQKIKPNFTKYLKKIDEQKFLSKKICEILKEKVSTKCSKHESNYNKIQIEKIMKENELSEIIKFLNKTVIDAYEIYIGKNNLIEDFNINDDLKKIEKKNGKEYAEIYKNIALELISKIKKKGRKE